jgi:hypothetical protein
MAKTSMFTRARLQLPLTASERALLKLLQGSVVTILTAGVMAALPYLEGQAINWTTVIRVGAGAAIATLVATFSKYFTAQGDNAAAALTTDIGAVIAKDLSIGPVPTLGSGVPPTTVVPATSSVPPAAA